MQNKNDSFMDSRTIIAIILVGVVWILWQQHLKEKYPRMQERVSESKQETQPVSGGAGLSKDLSGTPNIQNNSQPQSENQIAQDQPEKNLVLENDNLRLVFSSKGMSIKSATIKKYFDRKLNPVEFLKNEGSLNFETGVVGKNSKLHFDLVQLGASEVEGTANFMGTIIKKRIKIIGSEYKISTEVEVSNIGETFTGLSMNFVSQSLAPANSSFLNPTLEKQEFVLDQSGKVTRTQVNVSDKSVIQQTQSGVAMMAVDTHYFTMAWIDRSEILPEAKLFSDAHETYARAEYVPVNRGQTLKISGDFYIGPKELSTLKGVDQKLSKTIDYGSFDFIAKPMLALLKFLYSLINNWGIAIIILTIIVRLLVLPFNIMSYKSMKAMQKVQPLLNAVKEKYKGDSESLNRETMAIMKQHKVNPVGGCLPMLLQLPVFIALYQVLSMSIELYQTPFFGWIQDLSLKDPFYVLPVLMGIAMFVQQKITPSAMDPTQAKIMLAMPVVFSLMMISLPSGLTLYIFVSTLFGVVQQVIFMREKKAA